MEKKTLPLFILTLLLIGTLKLEFYTQPAKAEATIWTVDDDGPADFHTIQEAVNASSDGDTIQVRSGTYQENVIVHKILSLFGENASTTIIDANQTLGAPVTIKADNVYLAGFTMTNSGRRVDTSILYSLPSVLVENCKGAVVTSNVMRDNSQDLRLKNSSNCMIFNNIITEYGIKLYYSSHNTITNNTITNCTRDCSVLFYGSSNNTLSGNTIFIGGGIKLDGSTNNRILGNTVHRLVDGIELISSGNNQILDNNVSRCGDYGILLFESSGNTLSNNNMSENDYNFAVYGELNTPYHWDNHVHLNNTANGKPIYYLTDMDNIILDTKTNAGTIYLINCKNITIKDLTLKQNGIGIFLMNTTNSEIENVSVKDNDYGIVLGKSNNNTLMGNAAQFNDEHGFWLSRSNSNVLSNNIAYWSSEADGINLYHSTNNIVNDNTISLAWDCGIELEASSNNVISSNIISETRFKHGIMLKSSSNNTFIANTVSDNWEGGIVLETSNNNTLSGNTITNNGVGFKVETLSSDNSIYHNNFLDNSEQVVPSGPNTWDDSYPSGGNYWSDHVCTGNPSDGSQSYIIDENNIDRYPFQDPNGWLLLGDINNDGTVDIFDVVLAANAFSSTPEDPNWNQAADLNNDDVVDIFDIVLLANNFGKTT